MSRHELVQQQRQLNALGRRQPVRHSVCCIRLTARYFLCEYRYNCLLGPPNQMAWCVFKIRDPSPFLPCAKSRSYFKHPARLQCWCWYNTAARSQISVDIQPGLNILRLFELLSWTAASNRVAFFQFGWR